MVGPDLSPRGSAYHVLADASSVVVTTSGGNGMTLAGINGTILAIVVAALLGYVFIVFQHIDKMQTDLIARANGIRDMRIRYTARFGPWADEKSLDQLCNTAAALARKVTPDEATYLLHVTDFPEDETERGRILGCLVYALSEREPFRLESPLETVRRVRDWRELLDETSERLLRGMTPGLGQLRRLIALADADAREASPSKELFWFFLEDRGMDVDQIRKADENSGSIMFEEFVVLVNRANVLAQQLRTDFHRLDNYKRLRLQRLWNPFSASLILVAFICGVAAPMVHPTVSSVVDAWIPAALYVAALLFGVVFAFRSYWEARS